MIAAFLCSLRDFSTTSRDEKLGKLTSAAGQSGFPTQYVSQISAWESELSLLGNCIEQLLQVLPQSADWTLLLEYPIARREKRPDAVLIADDLIVVMEFKIGADTFQKSDLWQVLSYALDLRDFHAASANRTIVPALIATGNVMGERTAANVPLRQNGICTVQRICATDGVQLSRSLVDLYELLHDASGPVIDAVAWDGSPYQPSPNIIEAAEELFAGHSVTNISHSFAINLKATTETLVESIVYAQAECKRVICFVTGIPGAGKTLAGLNTVHDPAVRRDDRPAAVFLSGNGPLVKIVREALTRNRTQSGIDRRSAEQAVSAFINNVHTFLKHYGIQKPKEPPHEHAVVFDEAQRAWNAKQVLKTHEVNKSEPELFLEIMERAPHWCVVIALVGGGQEINTGEGGLGEWGRALNKASSPWLVFASSEVVTGGEAVAGHRLFEGDVAQHLQIECRSSLHLDVGVRSPRAKWLGAWVNTLLSSKDRLEGFGDVGGSQEFPIGLTRNLDAAKRWLREHGNRDQRHGLLASSGALRLRAYGIEVSKGFRDGIKFGDWFLADSDDCRSSMSLEVAATEFECQGLELDWTCVCWGGDLIIGNSRNWTPRKFRGRKWQFIGQDVARQYVINKYRVLLTRARRGMVVWVPKGDPNDPTRQPQEMDAIADALAAAGLPDLSN